MLVWVLEMQNAMNASSTVRLSRLNNTHLYSHIHLNCLDMNMPVLTYNEVTTQTAHIHIHHTTHGKHMHKCIIYIYHTQPHNTEMNAQTFLSSIPKGEFHNVQ